MIDCVHPGSCRHCFLSSDPELFDAFCTKDWDDKIFEDWAAKTKDKQHAEAVRNFREWEKKRDAFYKRKRY